MTRTVSVTRFTEFDFCRVAGRPGPTGSAMRGGPWPGPAGPGDRRSPSSPLAVTPNAAGMRAFPCCWRGEYRAATCQDRNEEERRRLQTRIHNQNTSKHKS
eukprot:753966-Hanusia_phi.AAC.7